MMGQPGTGFHSEGRGGGVAAAPPAPAGAPAGESLLLQEQPRRARCASETASRALAAGIPVTAAAAVLFLCRGGVGWTLGLVLAFLCLGQVAALILSERARSAQLAALRKRYDRVQQLAQLNSAIIASFAMAIDAKDQHSQGHTERVRDIAILIGQALHLGPDELEALRMAAMLHDIGKLAVPDYILAKPNTLTQEEMRKVQTHTLVAAALLESVNFPWPVVPIIRSHHECHDGSGYPDGLAGDDIPLGARILAVADVYDALLSHRPYRPARSVSEAVQFIADNAGSQFDPRVVETCLQVLSSQQPQQLGAFIFDAASRPLVGTPEEGTDRSAIFADIRQAHQELLALYEIVQSTGQSLDVQETMELVIGKTKRIIDFATCVFYLCQQDGDHLTAAAASGPHAELIRGRRLPHGTGLSGSVVQTGKPSGLGRAASEDLEALLGQEAEGCALVHAVSAPLVCDTGPIGAITFYRPASRPFDEDDARLVVAVAKQAAIAIKNARDHDITKQSALTDELTGLANARYFFLRLEQELSRARRENRPVSLIAIDLNGLKQINDNYGHQQGDRALRVIAEVFRRHVRDYDTVVRYAGDEFFIILPDTTNKIALETANRIKEAARETTIEVLAGRYISLSASFGVATFPGDAEHSDALIAVADQAMYADKRLSHQAALLQAQGNQEGQENPRGIRLTPRL